MVLLGARVYPPAVARILPFVYFALLAAEAVGLALVYAVLQPASSSLFNVALGTVGLVSMVVMLVYSIARRSKTLRGWARLSTWLHLHIFLGVQGVLLVFFHCVPMLYREGHAALLNPGILNLIAVAIVFFSGLFGRYLYAQVPKTLGGQHMAIKALEEELSQLQGVPNEVATLWAGAPARGGVFAVVGSDFQRRSALRRLDAMGLEPQVHALAARRVTLEWQKAVLGGAQGVFRLWIVLHRPLALAMYFLSFVHIALALMFTPSLRFW
jgi:hypothetical protein